MVQQQLRMVSWNVNGIRAVMKKGFQDSLASLDADIVALQETKIQEAQLTGAMRRLGDYEAYFSHATVKKGYSGVAVYTRVKPVQVSNGIGVSRFDNEGCIIEMNLADRLFFRIPGPV